MLDVSTKYILADEIILNISAFRINILIILHYILRWFSQTSPVFFFEIINLT